MTNEMIFGAVLPTGWNLELASYPDSSARWNRVVEIAQLIERLGFDSLWLADHVYTVPRPQHEDVFETWAVIAALTQLTTRVQLGQMVSYHGFRTPALSAKMTATIDVMSRGRLIWGVGAGWYRAECLGYGYDFPGPKERLERVAEFVEIVRAMWTEAETTYAGKHYKVSRANCEPKPLQRPHPPILIGGGGEKSTLRLVARLADWSNWLGPPDVWAAKRDALKRHCADLGRDEAEIRKTWAPQIFIRETEADVLREGPRFVRDGISNSFEEWHEGNLVGTPERVVARIQQYAALGCGGVVVMCADYPSTQSLELFAREVVPHLRS